MKKLFNKVMDSEMSFCNIYDNRRINNFSDMYI